MKQSTGLTWLSRDHASRAITLEDDKSGGGSPEDPHNPSTTPVQLSTAQAEDSFTESVPRDKFHKHCPVPEVLVFLQFQQYLKQTSLKKHNCKPQRSLDILSKSFQSLKTALLSLNTRCRSNGLPCQIHHGLKAQLWTEEQLEYHDSNKK